MAEGVKRRLNYKKVIFCKSRVIFLLRKSDIVNKFTVILYSRPKTREANITRRKPNITAKQYNSPIGVIRLEDVEAYLQKKRSERRKEIPVGIFNAKPTKQTVVINNNRPMDSVDIGECFVTIADECRDDFRTHVEKRLWYFPDALTADKAAEIIGYAPHTVL